MTPYATFFLYLLAAVGLVGLILGMNAFFGPRPAASAAKLEWARHRNVRPLSIKYYPIAIFFLLFDLETVLLFIWAAAAGQAQIATLALVSFLVFMALLAVAFVYLWRDGALEWR
jgi:NADH-quinone oxidoreductase subunit A